MARVSKQIRRRIVYASSVLPWLVLTNEEIARVILIVPRQSIQLTAAGARRAAADLLKAAIQIDLSQSGSKSKEVV